VAGPGATGRLRPRNEECAGGIPGGRTGCAPIGPTHLFPHRVCFALRPAIQPQFQTRHLSVEQTTPPAPGQRNHRIRATRLCSAGLHFHPALRPESQLLSQNGGHSRSGSVGLHEQLEKRQALLQLKCCDVLRLVFMANACPVTPTRRRLEKSKLEWEASWERPPRFSKPIAIPRAAP
jgi:hypothetical protein